MKKIRLPATGPLAAVAGGNNRVNTSGLPPAGGDRSILSRGSGVFNNIIAPGQTLQMPISGNEFYILVTTAPIQIRPSGGIFTSYATGQGLDLDTANTFSQLDIFNPTANSVVFSLFVGYDEFIDKTLILNPVTNPAVIYPTYQTPLTLATVNLVDLSGQAFTDINGGKWYAINRVCMSFFNVDTGATFLVQKSGAATASGPAVAAVYPQTSLRLDASGNYTVATGGGNINMVISEIYQAIPRT